METTKPIDGGAARPGKVAEMATPETGKKKRPPSTRNLLRAKKKFDEAVELLAGYTDLQAETTELRRKVFERFVAEEEGTPPRAN